MGLNGELVRTLLGLARACSSRPAPSDRAVSPPVCSPRRRPTGASSIYAVFATSAARAHRQSVRSTRPAHAVASAGRVPLPVPPRPHAAGPAAPGSQAPDLARHRGDRPSTRTAPRGRRCPFGRACRTVLGVPRCHFQASDSCAPRTQTGRRRARTAQTDSIRPRSHSTCDDARGRHRPAGHRPAHAPTLPDVGLCRAVCSHVADGPLPCGVLGGLLREPPTSPRCIFSKAVSIETGSPRPVATTPLTF